MAGKDKKPKGFGLFRKLALFLLILIIISGVVLYSFLGINPADILAEGATGLYNKIFTVGAAELSEAVRTVDTYDVNEKVSFATVSDDLLIASISAIKRIDSEGREKGYIPVSLKNPYIQAYKEDLLIADIQGHYFGLVNENRVLWEKTIDEDIVDASISDAWVLLITKSKETGYKRTIRAYSRDGQEISLRNISNYYPYSAVHHPEYSKASFLISGIEASGLESNGLFDILDPAMNQMASIRGEKEIFLGGFPGKKENLILFGERSITAISREYKTVWENKPTGVTITGANVINMEFPIAAELNNEILSRERRHESTIRIYNDNGSERAHFLLDSKVSGISSEGRTAAVIAGAEVYFVNHNGDIMDLFTAKSDIKSVHLAKEDLAYVAASGTITRIKIKTTHKFLGIF